MEAPKQSSAASLVRNQFRQLHIVGTQVKLDEERQRRLLLVSQSDWRDWSVFLRDGPLPARPEVPVMLRRLGAATYRLAALAERQTVGGR
ncbi:MAG TPA: hypothetical protein VK741_15775 [Acetobacteraceae bacterium]|nr:hypothetical protein [Acetobacteraceae bacterium]